MRALVAGVALAATAIAVDPTVLPVPTGSYAVGRTSLHLVDSSRTDTQGSRPDHHREFMVVAWYPAETASSKRASWFPSEWADLEAHGLLETMLSRSTAPGARDVAAVLRSIVVGAREDAPVARSGGAFPVLVFAPGNYMFPTEYAAVIEEMASRGYVVLGYVPTGFVTDVSFPDGRVTHRYATLDFSLWNKDLEFLIDQATAWSLDSRNRFFGRLDVRRLGMFGHSAGGSALSDVAREGTRVKAALGLDPGLLLPEKATGIPFLLLNAENADFVRRHPDDPQIATIIQQRRDFFHRSKPGIQVTLSGADHNSFTDMTLVPAFARPGDGKAFIATTRAFVREFFDEFLNGRRSELLRHGSADFPLAKVESANWP